MPILKKQVQDKASRPEFLRDDEEVFHCQMTNEIFRDYEDFAERTILCNSMVWTCSMTGKSNLTYTEALQSEDNARRMLQDFPYELRIPLLFLASKTKRNSFKDMAEDVFSYMKDRYFVGENIEACFSDNKWRDYHVLQVMAPTGEGGDSEAKRKKGTPPKVNGTVPPDRNFTPHSSLYKYDLEQLDAEDEDISEKIMVDMTQMRRKKGVYSKDKNKLFLKQYVEQGSHGFLAVKEAALESFGIYKMKFEQIFDGPLPKFGESVPRGKGQSGANVLNGKKVKQETLAKFLTKDGKQGDGKKNGELLEKMKQRELEFKRKKEELKQKATDDKEKKKLEDSKIQGLLKDWFKPKDDLEVEDQRILPVPTSVQCRIPEKYLGDALCVLEFINTFKKALKTKDIFAGGLTLELMERALIDKEVAGPLPDIVQLLLGSIFRTREQEAAQYKNYYSTSSMRVLREEDIPDAMSMAFASRAATNAWYWSKCQHGFPLSQLSLYSLTVTEILRIHLLSSGAMESEDCTRWRFQMRGGYTAEDDPGLYLRLQYPQLLRSLAVQNIIELSCGDKLKLLHCLMNQLLTYTVFRDQAEDTRDSIKANKMKIRSLASKKKPAPQKEKEGADKKPVKGLDPAEIEKQIEALHADNLSNSITLGTDRSYRRYIKLEAIPGFFVENEEDNAGVCLASPIKQYPQLNGSKKAVLSKHLLTMSEEMNTSDKENEPKSPSKKMMNGFSSKLDIIDNARLLSMCTGNHLNCSVHCDKQFNYKATILSRWTFYHNETQVDELISGLNVRGMREGELKQILQSNESRIRSLVSKTPVSQLSTPLAAILEKEAAEATDNAEANSGTEEQLQQQLISSSRPVRSSRGKRSGGYASLSGATPTSKKQRYEDVTLGYPEGLSATEVMHLAITDNILEMEEKICGGNLGHLKLVKGFTREKWREALTTRLWDKVEDGATMVHAKDLYKVVKENGSRPSTPNPDNQPQVARKEDRYREYMDPGTFIGHNDEEEDPDTSSNGDAIDPETANPEQLKAVKGLALALSQLGQSVGNKYLKKPLGHGDITSKSLVTKDVLPRWQQSLLASTSYSQLFLHYNTLDNCIMWSRSALLAWCRICRRKRDSENMLLCDSCNNGHHLYCLRPKLTAVPKGDWFCDNCKKEREPEVLLPQDVIPRKKRRIFRDEDISDEEETEEEEEWHSDDDENDEKDNDNSQEDEGDEDEEEDEEEEQEEVIVDNNGEEQGEEHEDEVEEEIVDGPVGEQVEEVDVDHLEEEEDEEVDEDNEDILMDECNHCKSGGELLNCDDCKLSYHLECVNPPLRRAPRGSWTCTECKERKECEAYSATHIAQQYSNGGGGSYVPQRRCAERALYRIHKFISSLRGTAQTPNATHDSDEVTSSRRSNRRDIDQRDDLPLHNAALQELLSDIMKHKDAWPFIRPVQKNEVPDYYEVISKPMDFGTIKYKLNMGKYNFDAEFMADSVLVFENCNTYNNSDAEVYKCGVRLLKHFSKKCNELGLKTPEEMQFDEEDNQPIVKSKAKKRRTK